MDLGLRNKSVMVAAASKGIGFACARTFLNEGARVSICARGKAELEQARAGLARTSGANCVLAVPTDLTRAADVDLWLQRTLEQFQTVDVLVASVGGPPPGSWDDIQNDSQWQHAFELTVLTTVRLIRAVIPTMREGGGGRIVTIQSSSVKEPIADMLLSNSLRPGVVGLAKTLASELARDNIQINTVAPGRIATDRLEQSLVDHARKRGPVAGLIARTPILGSRLLTRIASRDIPTQRLGTAEEVANMIAFLSSDRASYVTGSTISVDGGLQRSLW
ncbi:MAG: SDR family oxidoreductase [Chloroflexota bacterium]